MVRSFFRVTYCFPGLHDGGRGEDWKEGTAWRRDRVCSGGRGEMTEHWKGWYKHSKVQDIQLKMEYNGKGRRRRSRKKKGKQRSKRRRKDIIGKVAATDLIGSGAGVQTGGVRGSVGRLLGNCGVRGVMRALPQGIEEPGRQLGGGRRRDGHEYQRRHILLHPPVSVVMS